jgi:hypothetical protein
MAVLTTIALKFHLGLVIVFFQNITDSAVKLEILVDFTALIKDDPHDELLSARESPICSHSVNYAESVLTTPSTQ